MTIYLLFKKKSIEIKNDKQIKIVQLFSSTDGALLIQPLANQAQSASARSKPDLVGKVAGKERVQSHLN